MSLVVAMALTQAAAPAGCTAALCDADRLRPVFAKLRTTASRRAPVRIVQIGDSHTAGDQITGSWRTLLQARFGSAGRGILPPGRPYPGYLTRGVTASQSAGWTINGLFGPAYRGAGAPPIGLSGYSLSSATPGASIGLSADAGGSWFDRLTVCAIARPGGGTLHLATGDAAVDWSLDAPASTPVCRTVASGRLADTAAVSVVAGAVTITSWATERSATGGVILSNLGTVGAQFEHFGRTDAGVVATELATYRPDAIVVSFGTNEAFRPGFRAEAYRAALTAALTRLRRLAPDVPLLVLGAPDSATRLAGLQAQDGLVSAACDPSSTTVPPQSAATADWRPTAALAVVQAIQRRVAHDVGAAFWDWSARMGGRCVADGWTTTVPPLMRRDRVHFTSAGGARIAALLQADWDAAMAPSGTPDHDPSVAP